MTNVLFRILDKYNKQNTLYDFLSEARRLIGQQPPSSNQYLVKVELVSVK